MNLKDVTHFLSFAFEHLADPAFLLLSIQSGLPSQFDEISWFLKIPQTINTPMPFFRLSCHFF
jgi:hypothetical protein